jgi:2-keto-4-pentenoate hydratase/2-oxohepta-3-ene-1,7-dioic acid hydratase in catechol pathway
MKIFCVGRNYAAHAKELGNEVPEDPVIFMKPETAILQQPKPFYYPVFTNELHYECELVIRISKSGKHISEEAAGPYYDAITAGIDFTARDIQNELKAKGLPWEKAKAWDNSAIVGKWLPLADIRDIKDISFGLYRNKELVQQGRSSNMIHSFGKIISHISGYFSLDAGDLVFTGTPAGVGATVAGDELEGFLENNSMFRLEIKNSAD